MLGRGTAQDYSTPWRMLWSFHRHRSLPAQKDKYSHYFSSISWFKVSSLWLIFFLHLLTVFLRTHWIPDLMHSIISCAAIGATLCLQGHLWNPLQVCQHSWSWGWTESSTAQKLSSLFNVTVRGSAYKSTPLLGLADKKGLFNISIL